MNTSCKLRTFFIFVCFLFIYVVILFNLYLIQILNADYFANLAHKQYNITITTQPPRAIIYDRHKNPVAVNKESLSAFILPHKIEDPKNLKYFLNKNFPSALERLNNHKNKFFMYVKRKLTPEQLQLIDMNNISDIKILTEPSRFYPIDSMGTIIGVTDIDNKGLFGIERELNKQLAGSSTTMTLEKDARSGHFYFKKETTIAGKDSQPVTLTIDSKLQFLANEELKDVISKFEAKEGAVIIINPDNGHILAMTNYPHFNPNETTNLDLELTKNCALTNSYEFGSVMKVFVALAALDEGVVTPDELIDCENVKQTKVDGMSFTTLFSAGLIPFSEVVEKSNNIGMVKVAKRLGPKLYDHYLRMGFGKKTGLGLGGEVNGFINHPTKWSKRSIISLSFGYEITATLLQLARAFGIIANNGYEVTPQLILKENDTTKTYPKRLYDEKVIDQIKAIMQNTVTKGTAKKAAIKGYKIMGKTGTANLVIDGTYNTSKNIYSFVGIIEKDNYKRVIATYVKESPQKGLYSSLIVVPLFEQIAEKLLIHDKII